MRIPRDCMPPDWELRLILCITRRLPKIVGSKVLGDWLAWFYLRRARPLTTAQVFGWKMELDPQELIERELLFYPQLFERREIQFLRSRLSHGSVFLDLGSNVGGYSLALSRTLGEEGIVLAADADPYSSDRLASTVARNGIGNIRVANVGLSDEESELSFFPQLEGNRGGGSFLTEERANGHLVKCIPLIKLLSDCSVRQVTAAKLDLEGFEFRVLAHFFANAPRSLWPQYLLVERSTALLAKASGDVNELIKARGYGLVLVHGENFLWNLKGPRE